MAKLSHAIILSLLLFFLFESQTIQIQNTDNSSPNYLSPHIQSAKSSSPTNENSLTQSSIVSPQKQIASTILMTNTPLKDKLFQSRSHIGRKILSSDNNNNSSTPPPTPTDAQVGQEDLEEQVESTNANINTNLKVAEANIKDSLNKAIKGVTKTLEKAADTLDKEMIADTLFMNQTINNSTAFLKGELKSSTLNLTKQIKTEDNDVVSTIDDLQELTEIEIEDEIEKKEAELQQVNNEITRLKSDLPPPSSVCNLYTDCTTCAANPQCGWCAEDRLCVQGDNMGPLSTSCEFYDYQVCSGSGCIIYSDCDSCISDAFCGWCYAPELGINKCLERPANYTGCPAEGWFNSKTNNTQCPPKIMENLNPLTNQIIQNGVGQHTVFQGLVTSRNAQIAAIAKGKQVQLTAEQKEIQQNQEELVHDQQQAETLLSEIAKLEARLTQVRDKMSQDKINREALRKQVESEAERKNAEIIAHAAKEAYKKEEIANATQIKSNKSS